MTRIFSAFGVAAIVLMAANESAAQGLGASAYVSYGSTRFEATETFETVLGKTSHVGVGFGGRVDGLWGGLFVDAGVSQQSLEGQRVFVSDGSVFPLGIPMEITYRPIDIAAGWRFAFNRVLPYVGGGATIVAYRETSDFAQPGDDTDERKTGALLLAGVDVAVARFVRVGGEFRYRAVTGVLGTGGVSEVFGEDALGGRAFALRVSVGR